MRALGLIGAVALLVTGVGVEAAGATGPVLPTVTAVVRPVTAGGTVAAGYTVVGHPAEQVDCSLASASPAAVNGNIDFCAPSAAYAVACWKSALAGRVLCLRSPLRNVVDRIPRAGSFHATSAPSATERAPLAMTLGNGAYCTLRDGGAWTQLPGHPHLFGTYACLVAGGHVSAVWAATGDAHQGVNESSSVWTVRTASFGSSTLYTRHVVKAWFVGTASG